MENKLELTDFSKSRLLKLAKYYKYILWMAYVGLAVLALYIIGALGASVVSFIQGKGTKGVAFIAVAIAIGLFSWFPINMVKKQRKFQTNLTQGVNENNQEKLDTAIANIAAFTKIYGTIVLVYIAVVIIYIVIMLIALLTGGFEGLQNQMLNQGAI